MASSRHVWTWIHRRWIRLWCGRIRLIRSVPASRHVDRPARQRPDCRLENQCLVDVNDDADRGPRIAPQLCARLNSHVLRVHRGCLYVSFDRHRRSVDCTNHQIPAQLHTRSHDREIVDELTDARSCQCHRSIGPKPDWIRTDDANCTRRLQVIEPVHALPLVARGQVDLQPLRRLQHHFLVVDRLLTDDPDLLDSVCTLPFPIAVMDLHPVPNEVLRNVFCAIRLQYRPKALRLCKT